MPPKPIQTYLQYPIKAKARKPLTAGSRKKIISSTFCRKFSMSINLNYSTDYKRAYNSQFPLFFSDLDKKKVNLFYFSIKF